MAGLPFLSSDDGIQLPLGVVLGFCDPEGATVRGRAAAETEGGTPMSRKIEDIEGIGSAYREKLAKANIATTDDLLSLCCDANGRNTVAHTTGLSETHLLKWANMADLMRISGVGGEFAELLEASGVDTIKELRNRSADNLATKMKEVNEDQKLTRAVASSNVVQGWIDQAKKIDPKISY